MIKRDVDSLYLNMQDGGTTSPRNQQWPKVKDVIVDEGASAAGVRRLSGSTRHAGGRKRVAEWNNIGAAPEWMTGENVEHYGNERKFEDGETRDKGNVEESREDENEYEDTDLLALMRKKRGRSPSPRRRRRARSTEDARRAANRTMDCHRNR